MRVGRLFDTDLFKGVKPYNCDHQLIFRQKNMTSIATTLPERKTEIDELMHQSTEPIGAKQLENRGI
jgi:hypothetical protein